MSHSSLITQEHVVRSKAFAEAAVLWSTQATVNGRVCRLSYGSKASVIYERNDPEHKNRTVHLDEDGQNWDLGFVESDNSHSVPLILSDGAVTH